MPITLKLLALSPILIIWISMNSGFVSFILKNLRFRCARKGSHSFVLTAVWTRHICPFFSDSQRFQLFNCQDRDYCRYVNSHKFNRYRGERIDIFGNVWYNSSNYIVRWKCGLWCVSL